DRAHDGAERRTQHCGQRVELRTFLMRWPEGTPDDVRHLADELAAVLMDRNGREVGPALALVFAYVVCELGGHASDADMLKRIMIDVGAIARRYGALKPHRPH